MSTQPNPSDPIRKVPCHACGLPQPVEQAHSIKGHYYCTNCLVAGAELAGMVNESDLSNYSASRAALFGLLPGLGAVYNNQYVKAVQHFAVFAGLVMLADYFVIFIFATIVFYFYTIIDAYRSAQEIIRRRIRQAQTGEKLEEDRDNVPLWGLALIALGTLFFLDNLNLFSIRYIVDFAWPLVFVALGLYLVFDFYRKSGESGQSSQPAYTGGGGYAPPSQPEGGGYSPPPEPPRASGKAQAEPSETPPPQDAPSAESPAAEPPAAETPETESEEIQTAPDEEPAQGIQIADEDQDDPDRKES